MAAARAKGASEEQLAILENGPVTFDEYQAAVGTTIACLRAAGIDVINDTVTQAQGYPAIHYSYAASSVGRTDDQTTAISDQCIFTNSFFVESEYENSPTVLEAKDGRFAQYRDALVACIRSSGGDVDDNADREHVITAADTVLDASGVNCLATTGYQPQS